MPLLNPPDILPEAMRFLLRALLAAPDGRLQQSTLLGLVAPDGLAEAMKALGAEEAADDGEDTKTGGRTIAQKSLEALWQLELVAYEGTGDDRLVAVTPAVRERFRRWETLSAPDFASFLRRFLLVGAVADIPLGKATGAADLVQGLALLHLAPDPLRPFTGFEVGDRTFQQAQYDLLGPSKDHWPLNNRERYPSFVRWATYLGFAAIVPPGRDRKSTTLVADASAALAELVDELVPKLRPVDEVVAAAGEMLPVLDGGRIHNQVRSEMVEPYPAGFVSPGLALSLQTLHHRGVIRLHLMSDAPILQFPLGSRPQPFSHVSPSGEED